MATQKPISTISYNSEPFLREKLESWLKAHIIQSYMFIKHHGEDGDKDHIHVRLEPNKKLDPMDLQESLREYEFGKDKPLGVRPFRPSKEEDWILYAVHDADYLKLKYGGGEKGEKIPYKWEDIQAPEDFDTEIAYIRARSNLEHTSANLISRIQRGSDAKRLIEEGENPFLVNALLRSLSFTDYERLQKEFVELNARHNMLVDAIHELGYDIEVAEDNRLVLVESEVRSDMVFEVNQNEEV